MFLKSVFLPGAAMWSITLDIKKTSPPWTSRKLCHSELTVFLINKTG